MSWFARSIVNTLNFDDNEEGDSVTDLATEHKQPDSPASNCTGFSSPISPSRGFKEDLSEFSQTLTRQLWGVASFLAPPPQSETKSEADVSDPQPGMVGIRGDFAEIGDKFKSGISLLSNNVNVSEITKMASGLLQLESDDESKEIVKKVSLDSVGKGAVGVTEEVVAFARDISMHPETWLDFPLPGIVGNDDDFDMSDAQQEHALAVEQLAPGLTALRIELCPMYMSESSFWKIYFILLHSRIDEHDAELLSTLQIVEARASLSRELKDQKAIKSENLSGEKTSDQEENVVSLQEQPLSAPSPLLSDHEHDNASDLNPGLSTATSASKPGSSAATSASEPGPSAATSASEPGPSAATSASEPGPSAETSASEPDPSTTSSSSETGIPVEDKSVVAEKQVDQDKNHQVYSGKLYASGDSEEDDVDEWLKEENIEIDEPTGKSIPIENEDDVSFSDLEEDDADGPTNTRKSNSGSDKDSREWVRL